jgi:CHAT domain-containing protein
VSLIKRKIRYIEKQADTMDNSSKEFADLQREIFINTEQLTHLDQLIKNNNPFYHQSLIDTSFISLKSVQESLKRNKYEQTILEFFNGDSAIYTLTITAEKSKITHINKKEFESKADQYSAYLSNPVPENTNYSDFVRTGHELYDLIFKESPLPQGRIIVSPDAKYFPLEALIVNTNSSAPVYFIKDHIVSYTYSVRFLLNDFNKKGILSAGNFLGLAPVQYPLSFHLTSLHQSDISLQNISSRFKKSLILTFSDASRHNFQQYFSGYRIIQLYSHSSDTSDHKEPVIYFSDSALYLSELIPEKQTAAQLIVLSACETGNGKLYKGEGVFSFNRGFAALGIPSSVINLWSVENESTYNITELFYKYAADGLPLDLALQKAKLEFIATSSKEKRLPYFWAAAILAGKTDAIEFTNGFSWNGVAIDIGIIFLCLAIIFFIRRKINKPFL